MMDFFLDNWKLLICVILAIANLIVAIVRKKVKVFDTIREFIVESLPHFIVVAEQLYKSGIEKKEFVIKSLEILISRKFGIGIEDYDDFIDEQIEKILATPQKKGKL